MIHHSSYIQQEKLLSKLRNKLNENGRLIMFEFSFPAEFKPSSKIESKFCKLTLKQRLDYQRFIDWFGNTVVANSSMPMPMAFRTFEEWVNLFKKLNFKIVSKQWIGFPKTFFHQGPYCIFVLEKLTQNR
jgi:hypothetical protein